MQIEPENEASTGRAPRNHETVPESSSLASATPPSLTYGQRVGAALVAFIEFYLYLHKDQDTPAGLQAVQNLPAVHAVRTPLERGY